MSSETNNTMKPAEVNNVITEGKANILLTSEKVFYNPVQEFNRDLSIAVLSVFGEEYCKIQNEKAKLKRQRNRIEPSSTDEDEKMCGMRILEALSATGLRSIRYAKELPNIDKIVANDLSSNAVQTIQNNIIHNQVEHLVETSHDDACMVMYKNRRHTDRFSAVDLDPYGCPSIFLDSAVQSVQDGGLLLVTATDMAVLAGNSPETCYTKYGAVSLKTKSCHEMALRILLQCIESHANRYSRYIVPLLSISADFYIRVFVKIYSGAIHCKKTTSKLSMVYQCVGCDSITLQPLGAFKPNPSEKNPEQMKSYLPAVPPVNQHCMHCNSKHHLGGPIWSSPIHDYEFVCKLLSYIEDNTILFNTSKRMSGVLSVIMEELHDIPLYYTLDKLFSTLHLETMPMLTLRSTILNSGYHVSYSHASKNSVKTDAPATLLWDILRTWEKTHPVKKAKLESDHVARSILQQDISYSIDMSERKDANPMSRRDGRLRYQTNPAPHWGPGTRAAARIGEEKTSKSILNQNKTSGRITTKELKQLKRHIEDNQIDESAECIKKTNKDGL